MKLEKRIKKLESDSRPELASGDLADFYKKVNTPEYNDIFYPKEKTHENT